MHLDISYSLLIIIILPLSQRCLFHCIVARKEHKHLTFVQLPEIWLLSLYCLQVKEKRAELKILKATFVTRASEFLRNYFASLVDFMVSDKSYFSQVLLLQNSCLSTINSSDVILNT